MIHSTTCGTVKVGDLWEDEQNELSIVTYIDESNEIGIEVVFGKHPGQKFTEYIDAFVKHEEGGYAYFHTLASRSLDA